MGISFEKVLKMFSKIKFSNRKIKIILISAISFAVLATVAVFIGYRYISKKPEKVIPLVLDGSSISIGKIHQTSTKNGIVEWSLEANSASYSEDKKEALFKDLFVTFFTKDDLKIYLNADKGTFKTESSDIEISGNITVKSDDYVLKTGKINYDNEKRVIFSEVPVEISGKSLNLVADSMTIDLDTNKAELSGKVEGIIGDDISL
ncbi:MAG: LPS export ABC transporter periplasmic protein LptC [Desulfobacteraceae bacterium]|nr:MAG: LPS export ABC transporter periplasmic protein LptC [Desulfobacteraceae bacterium]